MAGHLTFPIRGTKFSVNVESSALVAKAESRFQHIEIHQTPCFGRILLLDGHIQLTELDERVYHEGLVQFPLANLATPKSALVVGGGDGATVRELVRDTRLEQIVMVEIDEKVIQVTEEGWPELAGGALQDPRVQLTIGDAFPFVKTLDQKFDLIIVDGTDVYEGEDGAISEMLYTEEFYTDLLRCLAEGGIVVTQADNPVFCPYSRDAALDLFGKVFRNTGWYWTVVPSFGGSSAYVWGSADAQMSPSSHHLAHAAHTFPNEQYDLAFGPWPYANVGEF
ncbi:MAG: hypothetical protein KF812_07045 [Fimbriimonadaceae bacterium]|nr:hypothetical protein [Fimbriimonadaceae bacterium]